MGLDVGLLDFANTYGVVEIVTHNLNLFVACNFVNTRKHSIVAQILTHGEIDGRALLSLWLSVGILQLEPTVTRKIRTGDFWLSPLFFGLDALRR
jgi:hypothetical protein